MKNLFAAWTRGARLPGRQVARSELQNRFDSQQHCQWITILGEPRYSAGLNRLRLSGELLDPLKERECIYLGDELAELVRR